MASFAVLVTGDGNVKLLDFCLAKLAVASSHGISTTDVRVQGTPGYMSPEQASGKSLDERSDIFSFGAVSYEMLSGTKAFPGESGRGGAHLYASQTDNECHLEPCPVYGWLSDKSGWFDGP